MSLLQLHSLPENHSRHQRELQIQTMRAAALQATRGFGARATGEAYNQAHMLCRQLGGAAEIFPVLHGVFLFHMLRGEVDAGYQAAQECLQLARDQSDVIPLLFGHRSVGSALLHLGEFTRAREHLQEMLTMAESLQLETSTSAYGIHPRTAAPAFLSLTLFALGYPEQAQAAARDCVEQASRDRHPHNLSYALYWSNMTLIHCQDDVVVRDQAEQLIALGEQHGFSQWQAFGIFQCGCALARLNKDEDDGIAHMRSGLEKYQALGSELYLPLMFALLAEALIAAERTEEAEKLLSDAIVKAERMHERWFLAELYRRKGELLFRQSGNAAVAQAETYLQQAYDIAHAQQAKSWELRAATSLSRLWRAQGDPARARVLLEEVYDWFSEGYASEDLVAAKTLLDELA
jgi:predicted ATPase